MTRIILAVVLLFGCVGLSIAGSCRTATVQTQATPVVFQQLALPSYFPVLGQQKEGTNDELLRQILEQLKIISAKLEDGGQAPVDGGGLTMQVIATQACISCHQEGKDPKGNFGGFVLVDKDGKLAELTTGDKRLILTKVKLKGDGRMPPAKNLSPAALGVIEKFTAGK